MNAIFIIALVLLSGCKELDQLAGKFVDEVSGTFGISIPDNGKAVYEGAGGTMIRMVQTNAVPTVSVSPRVNATLVSVDLNGCDVQFDLSLLDAENALFWSAQPMLLEFDPTTFQCASDYKCDYAAEMINTVAEVTFSCSAI